jgi:hypothetical protein
MQSWVVRRLAVGSIVARRAEETDDSAVTAHAVMALETPRSWARESALAILKNLPQLFPWGTARGAPITRTR